MKSWSKHQRNDEKEVEIFDLNDKKKGHKKEKKSKQNTRKKSRNKEFAIVTYAFLILFIGMTAYFIYFVQVKSPEFINSAYNPRLDSLDDVIVRGEILASNGNVLAETQVDENGQERRVYPYGRVFSHAVGFSTNGMSGVEQDANFYLLQTHTFLLNKLTNEILDKKNPGDQVMTTMDFDLQQTCYQALGNYDGAVICIEPKTGKILSMVSKPDFDPNTIEADWNSYVDENSGSTALLNRATQGLYVPGSTFKILTLYSYLKQKGETYSFDCQGSFTSDGYQMNCYKNNAHGSENLMQAFGNSCNSAFSNIGLSLDVSAFSDSCDKLLFNQKLPTKLKSTAKSRMNLDESSSSALVMQTAIGQGETMVSPLHMAMLASAIANNGTLMEPYIVDSVLNNEGNVVKRYRSSSYGNLMSETEAQKMQEYLRYVVTDGTAQALNSENYEAYGKTGTAEFSSDKNKDHSWYVGYAKDETGKEIAIAVVMENVSSGSAYAVPATKQIYDAYFSSQE